MAASVSVRGAARRAAATASAAQACTAVASIPGREMSAMIAALSKKIAPGAAFLPLPRGARSVMSVSFSLHRFDRPPAAWAQEASADLKEQKQQRLQLLFNSQAMYQLLAQKLAEERAHLCPPSPTAVYDDPDSRVPTLGQVVGQWASRPRREHKALDPRTVRVGFWMPLSQFRVVAERVSAKRALQGAVQTVILQRADPAYDLVLFARPTALLTPPAAKVEELHQCMLRLQAYAPGVTEAPAGFEGRAATPSFSAGDVGDTVRAWSLALYWRALADNALQRYSVAFHDVVQECLVDGAWHSAFSSPPLEDWPARRAQWLQLVVQRRERRMAPWPPGFHEFLKHVVLSGDADVLLPVYRLWRSLCAEAAERR